MACVYAHLITFYFFFMHGFVKNQSKSKYYSNTWQSNTY